MPNRNRNPDVLPFQPTPIDARTAKRLVTRPELGPLPVVEATGLWRLWLTTEARYCTRCPRDACTLRPCPGMPTVSSCVQIVTGDVSAASAATLRID